MKICIDAHSLGDRTGGNETYYRNIIDNIHKFLGETDELIILLGNKEEKKKLDSREYKNIKTILFKYHNPIIRYVYEIPKIVKKYSIDVLHTQYYAPIIKNCKLAVTVHDISFEHYPELFNRIEFIRNKLWIKYTVKKADAILTVSEYSKQDIIGQYQVDKNKIFVTHLAPADRYKQIDDYGIVKIKQKFEIDGKYILAVGNLQPRKNLVRLINSYVKLKNEEANFDYKLVIVGKKAWKFEAIFSTINEIKLNDDLILTDYVSDDDLVALYNGAEVFVYPSIFEGFGLPVIEAMACGTPVITSNTSSLPEVAGDAAIMIDPYSEDDIINNIRMLCANRKLRDELRSIGINRAKQFSWDITAEKVIGTYHKIL